MLLTGNANATTDNPHDTSNTVSCSSCHFTYGSAPSWYTQGTDPGNPDSAYPFNRLCWACHTDSGFKRTHSNFVIYGVADWSRECRECHNPHYQRQSRRWGSSSYLYSNTSTSVTGNTITRTGAGWTDNDWQGMLVIGNTSQPNYNYRILSNNSDTLTVQGTINTSYVKAGNTFAIVYGKLVKDYINSRDVRFFRDQGANSFADGDGTYDGICEVCHTNTAYHKNDGTGASHNAATNCTMCHTHTQGFKGSCDVCHNTPPTTGKHATHFGTGNAVYGSTTIQSTASAYGFSCGVCHYGTHINTSGNPHTVEVIFAGVATQDPASGSATYTPGTNSVDDPGKGYTLNYSDGTCSDIYCHGNYPGSGKNVSLTFNTGTASCGSCHEASNTSPPDSGTHGKHAVIDYYYFKCTLCHKNIVSGSGPTYAIGDKSKHVSGYVDWNFDNTDPRISGGTYSISSGTTMPSNGTTPQAYGTCNNVYCHSNVQPDGGVGGPSVYATPQWGTTISNCNACHAGGHGNLITTGSHSAHLAYKFTTTSDAFKCVICHAWNTSFSLTCVSCHDFSLTTEYEKHANYQIDIVFDSAFNSSASYNQAFTPGNGYSYCSNTYCHSNGTSVSTGTIPNNTSPNWGSGALTCSACHGNPPDYSNGSPKANSHLAHSGAHGGFTFTCDDCHYSTTNDGTTITSKEYHVNKTYNVDAGAGVSFTYSFDATGGTCSNISCHNNGTAKWGGTVNCTDCHV